LPNSSYRAHKNQRRSHRFVSMADLIASHAGDDLSDIPGCSLQIVGALKAISKPEAVKQLQALFMVNVGQRIFEGKTQGKEAVAALFKETLHQLVLTVDPMNREKGYKTSPLYPVWKAIDDNNLYRDANGELVKYGEGQYTLIQALLKGKTTVNAKDIDAAALWKKYQEIKRDITKFTAWVQQNCLTKSGELPSGWEVKGALRAILNYRYKLQQELNGT
jgi:hypothetical protein